MRVGSPLIAATVALVDPTLTMILPKAITAYTSIDALVHAVEACTGRADFFLHVPKRLR